MRVLDIAVVAVVAAARETTRPAFLLGDALRETVDADERGAVDALRETVDADERDAVDALRETFVLFVARGTNAVVRGVVDRFTVVEIRPWD